LRELVIDRRAFLAGTGAVLLAAPLAAERQQTATKVWRIGWLSPPSAATGASEFDALRDGLRELNYVEGRNITIKAQWADGDLARLPDLARALVQLNVDIICTAGTAATLAAKQATTRTPIVFAGAAFPDRTGLVVSYARPAGNLTGIAFIGPEYGKRLELLREVAGTLSRVVLFYNDKNPAGLQALKETQQWADSLRVALEPLGVHDRPSLETAFGAMRRRLPNALMTTADPLILSYRTLIVEFANQHRLLSMYPNRDYVKLGGLRRCSSVPMS
jgi:putative tryptophan/tyrosine transport system substrate-binding protein